MLAETAIDAAALSTHSGGDAELGHDLLRIFRDAILPEALRLAEEPDPALRRALSHKVKGAALAIGAHRVAALADVGPDEGWRERFEAALHDLGAEIAQRLEAG